MLDLVWKDIIQGRRMLAFYLAVGAAIAISLAFAMSDVGAVIALQMTLSVYGFAIRSTYDDDKNGALLFLKGLPLSDAAIVASKFVSTFIVAVGFAVFSGGLAVVAEGFIGPSVGIGAPVGAPQGVSGLVVETFISVAAFFGLLLVLVAVYLAMFFCLGYARAAAYNRIVMLGVFAVVMAASAVLQRAQVRAPDWLGALGRSWAAPLVVACAGIVVYAVGCAASIWWVQRRDWS
ncbi:MAG: ABC-2 transporter permease [Betaproteobacteria bacterium]